jgi:hypothetical protein
MSNQHLDKLINAYLDEALTPADQAELETQLQDSEAARQRFWELAEVHGLAGDAARILWLDIDAGVRPASSLSVDLAQTESRRRDRLNRIYLVPLIASVVGLVIGIISTTAIWAATTLRQQQVVTIFHDSFESGPSPIANGAPIDIDAWGGDYSEIVQAWPSIRPVDGTRMLRFLRADYDGKEKQFGYLGDLYRVIDLRGDVSQFSDGNTMVSVEAAFASLALEESGRFSPSLSLHALEEVPANAEAWHAMIEIPRRLEEASLASARRQELFSSSDPWRRMSLEMRLPPKTRYLLVGLHIADLEAARNISGPPPAVEFEGQFVDDVRVMLHRHWALYDKTPDTLGQGKKHQRKSDLPPKDQTPSRTTT